MRSGQLRVATAAFIALQGAAAMAAPEGWDAEAAAAYLDSRANWWSTWPNAARDRGTFGQLSDDARTALDVMWKLQMKTGPNTGGWTWLNFNYEPWESPNSPYFGASLAALAVGTAPGGYAAVPQIEDNVKALKSYFAREHGNVALHNQLMGLWASGHIPDLLTREQRRATIDATFALQQPDGGWSTASLGAYERVDHSPNDTRTDGYATALATLALQEAGIAGTEPRLAQGLEWLRTHQDRVSGRWVAASLNKQRDPDSDAGKFMSDAATAYAVLSLTYTAR